MRTVSRFHDWCKSFAQAFPYIQELPSSYKMAIAQVLFESLDKDATKAEDVYELLRTIRNNDEASVKRSQRVSFYGVGWRGGELPRFANAYLLGYDFLSQLHYQRNPWHNPFYATEQLSSIIMEDKYIKSNFQIKSWRRELYGHGAKIELHIRMERSHYLGLAKSCARIDIVISLENLDVNEKKSFLEVNVFQRTSGNVEMTAIALAKLARERFEQLKLISPRDFASQGAIANDVVSHSAGLVRQFCRTLIDAIDQTKWKHFSEGAYLYDVGGSVVQAEKERIPIM